MSLPRYDISQDVHGECRREILPNGKNSLVKLCEIQSIPAKTVSTENEVQSCNVGNIPASTSTNIR